MSKTAKVEVELDDLLLPSAAALKIGSSVSKLAKSRMRDPTWVGPPYLKIGRQVYYRRCELRRWLDDQLVTPRGICRR